jgi:hypothetical protein
LPLILLATLASPARAESLDVLGYAGVLGEWELSATVAEDVSQPTKEFSTIDDAACRHLLAGWSGGKDR